MSATAVSDSKENQREKSASLSVAATFHKGSPGATQTEAVCSVNLRKLHPDSPVLGFYAIAEASWSGRIAQEALDWTIERLKAQLMGLSRPAEGSPELLIGQTLKRLNRDAFELNLNRSDNEKYLTSVCVCAVTGSALFFGNVGKCHSYLMEGDRLKRLFPEFGRRVPEDPSNPDRPHEAVLGERPECDVKTMSLSATQEGRQAVLFLGEFMVRTVDVISLTHLTKGERNATNIVREAIDKAKEKAPQGDFACVAMRFDRESEARDRTGVSRRGNLPAKASIAAALGLVIAGSILWGVRLEDKKNAGVEPNSSQTGPAQADGAPGQKPLETAGKPTGEWVVAEKSLEIRSSPPGASIWLNGKDTGLKTPARLKGKMGEKADVELRLAGRRTDRFSATYGAGPDFVERALVPDAAYRSVHLSCDPYCESVFIDGKEVLSRKTSGVALRMLEGERSIRAIAGGTSLEKRVTVGPGKDSQAVSFKFQIVRAAPEKDEIEIPPPPKAPGAAVKDRSVADPGRREMVKEGLLIVRTGRRDASVMIFKGTDLVHACLGECRAMLPAGLYTVEAGREGYAPSTARVKVDQPVNQIEMRLEPAL